MLCLSILVNNNNNTHFSVIEPMLFVMYFCFFFLSDFYRLDVSSLYFNWNRREMLLCLIRNKSSNYIVLRHNLSRGHVNHKASSCLIIN
jgi:hypothetical protein